MPPFYTWRKKYGGMDVSEARRLKALEDENARLKKLLAEAILDTEALKTALGRSTDRRGQARGRMLNVSRDTHLRAYGLFTRRVMPRHKALCVSLLR